MQHSRNPAREHASTKLPKSQHSKAKRALQEVWMAETKKDALAAFDAFVETWGAPPQHGGVVRSAL
jgi:hypothetical protein